MKIKVLLYFVFVGLISLLSLSIYASNIVNIDTNSSVKSSVANRGESQKININTAKVDDLTNVVKGIGKKRAQAIVKYRSVHGAFKTLDELALVSGLGGNFVKNHYVELKQIFIVN